MSLAEELHSLELSLLSPAQRYSQAELMRLLSEDFREFGASGVVYDRARLMAVLSEESRRSFANTDVSDFTALELGPGLALVTYRAAKEGQVSLRSSVWRAENGNWRMVFHQGTPSSV